MLRLSLFLLPAVLIAGPGYNGRWDITAYDGARRLAWWMEISGGGTPEVSGTFVGAPGGAVDRIPEIRIEKGVLFFQFPNRYADRMEPNLKRTGMFKAELVGDKLQGEHSVEGASKIILWTAVRAPSFPLDNPSMWKEEAPIELFNGKDLAGWRMARPDGPGWQVVKGILTNSQGAADLVSDQKFWNFKLHAEYRIGAKSNSGIGLRGRYEVQIIDDFGKSAAKNGNGAIYSRIAPSTNASKAPGEWQTFDITLLGNVVTVCVNGSKVISQEPIEGLTAIANNSDESQPGPLLLQGDHGIVEFRKLTVTPLTRR